MHADHRPRPAHRAENPNPAPRLASDRLAAKVAWLNHRAKHRAVFTPNVKQARAEIDARTARLEDEGGEGVTYTAPSFSAPGKCPTAWAGGAHDLIPHPEKPGRYVCPYALDQELSERDKAAQAEQDAAERAEANQKRAAEIATDALGDWIADISDGRSFREVVTAAALAGLESKES